VYQPATEVVVSPVDGITRTLEPTEADAFSVDGIEAVAIIGLGLGTRDAESILKRIVSKY
jgi:hypothetical protein